MTFEGGIEGRELDEPNLTLLLYELDGISVLGVNAGLPMNTSARRKKRGKTDSVLRAGRRNAP